MPRDDDQSLGDQQTYEGGAQPADSSDRSLGDQSTFGGGGESSLSDIGGLTGDADLDMEIVDLSRYEVQETLGKGGMGEVLLATDTRLNRKVAIKRMLGDAAKSQTAVKRFLTEAQSIAALNHFNIVQIHDYGRDKDGPFLIMEYVGGGSLLDKCREGALPLEEAVELSCQLCDGLSKAHDAGIIHRDIKPANILLTTDGLPKLTDFGLARQDTGDTGQTMAGAVLGTLDFMPPEQRRDATQTDNRSDLWSLAATLYQLVTGEPPRVIDLDEVPQELRTTLSKALKTKPDVRYQTAGEFKDALQATTRTAAQPIQQSAAELGAGECPKCHTRNESSRKFCSECAAALRVSCLKCETEIPVWDKVCGDCGGKQSELAASKLEEFARQRDQAEEHRREYRFEDAISIARSLVSVEDERIAEHVPWAEEFVTATEAEWEREAESAAAHFEEAGMHCGAFDYASAIRAVESIPEAMRPSEVSGYLQQIEILQTESEELIKTISDRVKRRDLKGLLEQVERAVELRGDRTDLQKLAVQLREREEKRQQKRDEACNEAKRMLDTGDAKGALTMIQSVPSDDLRSSDEQLRSQLEKIVAAEDELTALVKESKADGVLDPDEVEAMWQAANNYLQMNPRHEKIAAMQQQLHKKLESLIEKAAEKRRQQLKQRDEACNEAKRMLDTGDAKGALTMIQSVPSDDLRSSDEQLRSQLEKIVAAEDELTALVQESKADGVLDPYEVASMWQATNNYLKMNPQHENLRRMRQQLEARIQKAPIQYTKFAPLTDFWVTQPASVLSQLPARVWSQWPPRKNTLGMEFKLLPGGTFTMGEGRESSGDFYNKIRGCVHQVTLKKAFELGVYEVTQEQYEQVMGKNPSKFKGPQNPVETVRWADAVEFCRKLSDLPAEKKAGYVYRLPTEAEWEYACRAGTTTKYSFGDSDSELGDYAWFVDNSGDQQIDASNIWNTDQDNYHAHISNNNCRPHPVGGKKPNGFGLYDMEGNVEEWCQDWHGLQPSSSVTDPKGPVTGAQRVKRGSHWRSLSLSAGGSSSRGNYPPHLPDDTLGFRVVRTRRPGLDDMLRITKTKTPENGT